MKVLTQINNRLKFIGFDRKTNKKAHIRIWPYFLICFFFMIDEICQLVVHWPNLKARLEAMKTVVFFTLFCAYVILYFASWDSLTAAVAVIEKNKPEEEFKCKEGEELIDKFNKNMFILNRIILILIKMYSFFVNTIPMVMLALMLFKIKLNEINPEDLPLPYVVYYPPGTSSVYTYVVLYALLLRFSYVAVSWQYLTQALPVGCFRKLAIEIKLLSAAIREIERRISYSSSGIGNSELKSYLKYIVQTHQDIYRKQKSVNQGCQGILFLFQFLSTFNLCLPLYSITKDGVRENFPEVFVMIIATTAVFLYNNSAEEITKEEENLSNALYESNWLDKPLWYKKCLLLVMTRNSVQIKMKPFGLYTMNRQNFTSVMKVAYSYFNILNSM